MIHLDYCFLRRGEEGEQSIPVLVGKVRNTNYLIAHVVPNKGGSSDVVVAQLVKDFQRLGYNGKIILRGDQEAALEHLLHEVAKARGNLETIVEHSPVRDSSSSGVAEKGVQSLEGMVRAHLLELDEKIGEKLPLSQPWFSWMIEFCADVFNKHQVGKDGNTAWERIKGRKCHESAIEFGRKILHRIPGDLAGGLMQPCFHTGEFLGRRLETTEILVSMSDGGVVKARDFKEVPDADAWSADALKAVQGLPWCGAGTLPPQFFDSDSVPKIPNLMPANGDDIATRGLPLQQKHFELVGYTDGCAKCRSMQRGRRPQQVTMLYVEIVFLNS